MGRRMSGSVLLLTTLAFSLIAGDVLVLAAQDPPTPPPPTPQTQTPQTQTQPNNTKPGSKKTNSRQGTTTAPRAIRLRCQHDNNRTAQQTMPGANPGNRDLRPSKPISRAHTPAR